MTCKTLKKKWMKYSSFIFVLTDRTARWNQSVALENKSQIVQIKTKTGRVCGRTCRLNQSTTENGVTNATRQLLAGQSCEFDARGGRSSLGTSCSGRTMGNLPAISLTPCLLSPGSAH